MNILVSKNFKLIDPSTGWPSKKSHAELDYYDEMQDIMVKSAKKNLKGIDDIIIFNGEVENIQVAFEKNFFQLYELWKEGHNVIYSDVDVLWWRPINIFERYHNFSMFSYASEDRSFAYDGGQIKHYLNCAIRYQPATMTEQSWELGKQLWKDTNRPNFWDYEQFVYNRMLCSERSGKEIKRMVDPKMNWSMQVHGLDNDINDRYNRKIPLLHAYAIHYHASKSPKERLREIKKIWIEDD